MKKIKVCLEIPYTDEEKDYISERGTNKVGPICFDNASIDWANFNYEPLGSYPGASE